MRKIQIDNHSWRLVIVSKFYSMISGFSVQNITATYRSGDVTSGSDRSLCVRPLNIVDMCRIRLIIICGFWSPCGEEQFVLEKAGTAQHTQHAIAIVGQRSGFTLSVWGKAGTDKHAGQNWGREVN